MSDEELCKEAERLAGLTFTDEEIAIVLEREPDDLSAEVDERKTPLARAIVRGRLLIKAEVNNSIIKLAIRGSSPAQQMAKEMLKRIELQ